MDDFIDIDASVGRPYGGAMDFELTRPIRRATPVDERRGDERTRLRRLHGRGPWRRLSAVTRVRLRDGSVHKAIVHWYDADGIGRHEMKLKFPLLG